MVNDKRDGTNLAFRDAKPRLLSTRFVIIVAVVVASMVTAFLVSDKSIGGEPFAIRGGSPYALETLLMGNLVKPLPSSLHAKEIGELANIPTRSHLVKALESQGVSVSFNGTTYSSDTIAWGEATCLQASIEVVTTNAYVQGLDPATAVSELESSNYCLDQSIALAVFKQAAVEAAINSGHGATFEQAQAYAQQQLVAQESFDSLPNAPQLPAGQTAQSMTMCSVCILAYQQDLDLQYETAAITGSTSSSPTTNGALLNWFSNIAANSSTLNIVNVPSATSSNLASFLPWARSGAN
jgi:hypothetical protein